MTLENQEPGPIVIHSASLIAVSASGCAVGTSGIIRKVFNFPLVVATSACPRTICVPVELSNVASISRGSAAIGNTLPTTFRRAPTRSRPATVSSSRSQRAASKRLPTACPLRGPSLVKRYCIICAQLRPHSSSLHKAASAMRKSPGGSIGNSSRSRPLEPPLSATVTIAVISEVRLRSAVKVAANPCPPPRATTFLLNLFASYISMRCMC